MVVDFSGILWLRVNIKTVDLHPRKHFPTDFSKSRVGSFCFCCEKNIMPRGGQETMDDGNPSMVNRDPNELNDHIKVTVDISIVCQN